MIFFLRPYYSVRIIFPQLSEFPAPSRTCYLFPFTKISPWGLENPWAEFARPHRIIKIPC